MAEFMVRKLNRPCLSFLTMNQEEKEPRGGKAFCEIGRENLFFAVLLS